MMTAVLGVVDDVGQLLGREPDVQRVQHRPHAGDGEVGLQVALVVPAEGADPVALLDAEAGQGRRQLLGPGGHLGEGGRAVPARLDGDDGAVAVHLLPVAQDVADQERGVLHGAFHAPSMTSAPLACPEALDTTVPCHGRRPCVRRRRVRRTAGEGPDRRRARPWASPAGGGGHGGDGVRRLAPRRRAARRPGPPRRPRARIPAGDAEPLYQEAATTCPGLPRTILRCRRHGRVGQRGSRRSPGVHSGTNAVGRRGPDAVRAVDILAKSYDPEPLTDVLTSVPSTDAPGPRGADRSPAWLLRSTSRASPSDEGRPRRRAVGRPRRRGGWERRCWRRPSRCSVSAAVLRRHPRPPTAQIPPAMLTLYQQAAATAPACPGRSWPPSAPSSRTTASRTCPACTAAPTRPGPKDRCSSSRPPSPPTTSPSRRAGAVPPSPYDPTDAVYAAARLLCANGAAGGADLSGAVYAYNHSASYVAQVLALAQSYAAARRGGHGHVGRRRRVRVPAPWRCRGRCPRSGRPTSGVARRRASASTARVSCRRPTPWRAWRCPGWPRTSTTRRRSWRRARPWRRATSSSSAAARRPSTTSGLFVGVVGGQDVMVDAPHTGADVRAEAFPATPGAPFGSLLFVGATRPA